MAATLELDRDLKTLARFIEIYCDHHHADADRKPVHLATYDVNSLAGHELTLCVGCRRLLAHALVKRSRCPMNPKPTCKNCPNHCYAPDYRKQIREVMKYSGMQLVLRGRLDYLLHFLL